MSGAHGAWLEQRRPTLAGPHGWKAWRIEGWTPQTPDQAATLAAWLPWILIFSAGNAFMEELWFRGLWYGTFRQVVGEPAAIHVTSTAFCIMHVIVYWGDPVAIALLAPTWLFMGYAYALILRRTGSLWGPAVAHAVADVLYLYIAFSTGGL